MCKEVRDFPVPGGNGQLVLGDLIDRTPKEYISKVMLEEKLFDTWYGGRTVLLGDGKCLRNATDSRKSDRVAQKLNTLFYILSVLQLLTSMPQGN